MSDKDKEVTQRVLARFLVEAMSNLRSTTTGVDGAIIWVSAGEFAGTNAQHGPRIKVVLGNKITAESLNDSVTVTIAEPPIVLGPLPGAVRRQVVAFVKRNKDTLLKHWNGDIDTKEMLDLLKKV